MPPGKTTPTSAASFMDDLLAGLHPAGPPPRKTPQSISSHVASKKGTQTTLPPLLVSDSRRIDFSSGSPAKASNEPPVSLTPAATPSKSEETTVKHVSPPKNEHTGWLEGIKDWGDFELSEEDLSQKSTPDVPQPAPLSQSFAQCRVEKMPEDAQWNPLKKRMERRVEVTLKSGDATKNKTLLLCDEWTDLTLDQGNPLNIVSFPGSPPINLQLDPLVFSRAEPGHVLILFPSLLISATVISNAPFCSRRSVLSTRLKISSTEIGEPIVRGNIVHEVIQNSLLRTQQEDPNLTAADSVQSIPDTWDINHIMQEARKACIRHISDLFMLGKSADEGVKMVSEHLQHLPSWSSKYLIDRKDDGKVVLNQDAVLIDPRTNTRAGQDEPRIGITGVLDTEEEIWSPKYGLKGKIDVTVEAHVLETPADSKNRFFKPHNSSDPQIYPLEIKTGRQPSGIEHIAQTMLYTLLLSDRYKVDITAGLLFYTSRDDLIRVRAVKDELRHLMMARNRLARYMHSEPSYSPEASLLKPTDIPDLEDLTAEHVHAPEHPILPEPIDSERGCCKCFEVEGCMLYRKAVEQVDSLPAQRGIDALRELYERKTYHLTPVHTEFFRRWEALVSHEEKELGKLKKQIWTMSAEERERTGNALANMTIDHSFHPDDGSYDPTATSKIHRHTYRLVRLPTKSNSAAVHENKASSLLFGHISKHDPVVISIEGKRLGIARGFVLDLAPTSITVGLDHRLEEIEALPVGTHLMTYLTQYAATQPHGSSVRYRIDKDELLAGMGKIRDNLAQLFLENGNTKLRELVVDLRKPSFNPSHLEKMLTENNRAGHLNEEQVNVLTKVLAAEDYALVLGMPGTGKTTTIAELIKTLISMGKTVLLTSYTHSAVDNILSKLVDSKIDMLRLGNVDKVASALRRFTLQESDAPQSMEALEKKLMSPRLVATTSLSINHPLFNRRSFDYCIVDEASQVTLPTCLGPLRYANIFVLVGDHYQLPPLVKNPKAKAGGLETSLFKLLTEAHPVAVASLAMQYRMNDDIMSLSNALIYEGRLRSADPSISNLGLEIPLGIVTDAFHAQDPPAGCLESCWIADIMQPTRSVVFANTDLLHGKESKMGNQLQNEAEAHLALQLVNALVQRGVPASEIGIIAPYRQQIKLLSSLSQAHPELEILTADKSQGRDKACIIMSMVRNNAEEEVGELLRDWRRINVCLTRAKRKLVLLGSKQTLRHSHVLGQFFDFISTRGWIYDLQPDCVHLHRALDAPTSPSINPNKHHTHHQHLAPSSSLSKRSADHLSPSKPRPHKQQLSHHTQRLSAATAHFGVLRDVTLNLIAHDSSAPHL
ncbi:hypothetical protein PCANC_21857 [Puccinia coronata f. sp. avenae]|uniref:DNA replication ATP-dependent helicase/nuclease DNA2 n=1 Tax=Puccinia coronata f. sp. avenae TaxID=200324 RepID=A0A2N5SDP7_9BASI|nr:hypothetical protein PCANC_21857 [Puccinia coronata f. sp. avenae]